MNTANLFTLSLSNRKAAKALAGQHIQELLIRPTDLHRFVNLK